LRLALAGAPFVDIKERNRIEGFLRRRLKDKTLSVRPKGKSKDSAEVYIGDEFVATLSRDAEDGEVCWHFTMTILEMDLENGPQ
jgi:hypothetical protein